MRYQRGGPPMGGPPPFVFFAVQALQNIFGGELPYATNFKERIDKTGKI